MATPTQSLRLAGISLIGLICVGFSANLSAKLKVTGLDSAQEKNVRAWLSLDKLAEKADRRAVFRRYRMADKEIGSALQALGYYSPKIKRQLKYDEDQSWLAQFDIKAGERTTIQSFDIRFSGPGAAAIREVYSAPALLGEPLHHDRYRLLKEQLLNLAFSQGYLDAEITTSKLVIDPPKARAEIELVLETGMAFYFGDIDIQQNILNKEFLDRYVQIQSGDAFNPDRLLDLQLRLSDLDYFSNLDVSTERSDEDPPRISVSILATPKPPQHYQFGFGYGTDTGPRASLLTEFRHLNRNGHRLRSDLRIAESQQSWSARYLIPAGNEAGSNWSLKAAFSAEDFADARSESWQWTLARTRLSGASLWQYYGTYEIESFRLGDNPRKDTELLMPGISLTLREADNDLNPRKGFKVFADMHAAHADIASSDSFIQGLLQARYIHPLSKRSRLLLRGQLGTNIVGDISELPLSQRFFAGGDQSVRGYAYQSLGPTDQDGTVIGGKYLNVVSVELDRLFYDNYGAAIFFDYGGASDQPGEDLARGVGVGLRWRTGIGMLRADFAHPLDDPDGGFRVHIGFGAEL